MAELDRLSGGKSTRIDGCFGKANRVNGNPKAATVGTVEDVMLVSTPL
ncbi:MAG: hypothetical protein R8K50_01490 [Mariprofundus sp.]